MYWIDDRKGIRIGDKVYTYGDAVPIEKLDKKRQEKFADCLSKSDPKKAKKKVIKKEEK